MHGYLAGLIATLTLTLAVSGELTAFNAFDYAQGEDNFLREVAVWGGDAVALWGDIPVGGGEYEYPLVIGRLPADPSGDLAFDALEFDDVDAWAFGGSLLVVAPWSAEAPYPVEIYSDPGGGSWALMASLEIASEARAQTMAIANDTLIVVTLDRSNFENPLPLIEVSNFVNGSWSDLALIPDLPVDSNSELRHVTVSDEGLARFWHYISLSDNRWITLTRSGSSWASVVEDIEGDPQTDDASVVGNQLFRVDEEGRVSVREWGGSDWGGPQELFQAPSPGQDSPSLVLSSRWSVSASGSGSVLAVRSPPSEVVDGTCNTGTAISLHTVGEADPTATVLMLGAEAGGFGGDIPGARSQMSLTHNGSSLALAGTIDVVNAMFGSPDWPLRTALVLVGDLGEGFTDPNLGHDACIVANLYLLGLIILGAVLGPVVICLRLQARLSGRRILEPEDAARLSELFGKVTSTASTDIEAAAEPAGLMLDLLHERGHGDPRGVSPSDLMIPGLLVLGLLPLIGAATATTFHGYLFWFIPLLVGLAVACCCAPVICYAGYSQDARRKAENVIVPAAVAARETSAPEVVRAAGAAGAILVGPPQMQDGITQQLKLMAKLSGQSNPLVIAAVLSFACFVIPFVVFVTLEWAIALYILGCILGQAYFGLAPQRFTNPAVNPLDSAYMVLGPSVPRPTPPAVGFYAVPSPRPEVIE